MTRIAEAAKKFHDFMGTHHGHMITELHIMAGWKDLPDPLALKDHLIDASSKVRAALRY